MNAVLNTKDGFAIAGSSTSKQFNLGKNSQRIYSFELTFISYFYYWPASVDNIASKYNELKLYPNPTQDKIKIELAISGKHKWVSLEAADQTGRLVFHEHPDKRMKSMELDTSGWSQGMYLLKVLFENGTSASGTFLHV